MTHPLANHVERMAVHIACMAAIPGWVDYARERLRELLANPMYAELPELVRKELEAQRVDD